MTKDRVKEIIFVKNTKSAKYKKGTYSSKK